MRPSTGARATPCLDSRLRLQPLDIPRLPPAGLSPVLAVYPPVGYGTPPAGYEQTREDSPRASAAKGWKFERGPGAARPFFSALRAPPDRALRGSPARFLF